jgi:uncharacterized protein (TIGR04222 family)
MTRQGRVLASRGAARRQRGIRGVQHMLTMPGPQFLALYILLALVAYVFTSAIIARREHESVGADSRQLRDPCAIAYLRGDTRELLRVVALTLTLRGQLRMEGSTLVATGSPAAAPVEPIEAAVLAACAQPITAGQLAGSAGIQIRAGQYRQALIRAQLLAGPQTFKARFRAVVVPMAILVTLAVAKIAVALSTGHHNIGYLTVAAVIAVVVLLARVGRRLTAPGRRALAQLRGLFGGLQQRGDAMTGVPTEAALLAAVFGVYALGEQSRAWSRVWGASSGGDTGGCGGGGSDSGGGGGSGCGGGGGCGGCGGG